MKDVWFGAGAQSAGPQRLDRIRSGARFSFGRGSAQTFFQVYNLELEDPDFHENHYRGYGFGIGIGGTPVVSDESKPLKVIIPWEVGGNWGHARNTAANPLRVSFGSTETVAELGVGIEWCSFQGSLGLATNRVDGTVRPDGPHPDEAEYGVGEGNLGAYVDLAYNPSDRPSYARMRLQGGGYESVAFGIGLLF